MTFYTPVGCSTISYPDSTVSSVSSGRRRVRLWGNVGWGTVQWILGQEVWV